MFPILIGTMPMQLPNKGLVLMLNFSKICLAVTLAIGITSCGGSGSGSDTKTTPAPIPTPTMEITVIDGYLSGATVWLDLNSNYLLDDGEPTAVSGAGGRVNLNIDGVENPEQYPVLVKAEAGVTIDEDTNTTVTRNFVMSAQADQNIVTPLTTLIHMQVASGGAADAATATQQVAELVGIEDSDALLTDYKSNANENKLVAAISRNIAAILPESEQALSDDQAANDQIMVTSGLIGTAIVEYASTVEEGALDSVVVVISEDQSSVAVKNLDVDDAKEFIADVREWGHQIGSSLDSAGSEFKTKLQTANDIAESNINTMTEELAEVVAIISEELAKTESSNIVINLADHNINATGSITIDLDNLNIDTENVVFNSGTTFDLSFVLTNENNTDYTFSLSGSLVNGKTSFVIGQDSQIGVKLENAYDLMSDEEQGQLSVLSSNMALNVAVAQENEAGDGSTSFEGDFSATLGSKAISTSSIERIFFPENITLSGTFTADNADFFEASLDITVDASNYQPPENIEEGEVISDYASYTFADDLMSINVKNNETDELLYSVWVNDDESSDENRVYSCNYEGRLFDFCFDSDYLSSLERIDGTPAFPNGIPNVFEYTNTRHFMFIEQGWRDSGRVFYDRDTANGDFIISLEGPSSGFSQDGGSLQAELQWEDYNPYLETENNWFDIEATLSLTAQWQGAENASLTFNIDRTGYEDASASLTISYGSREIAVNVDSIEETGMAVITNENGIVMTINVNNETENGIVGSVNLGATKVADIRERNGLYYIAYVGEDEVELESLF